MYLLITHIYFNLKQIYWLGVLILFKHFEHFLCAITPYLRAFECFYCKKCAFYEYPGTFLYLRILMYKKKFSKNILSSLPFVTSSQKVSTVKILFSQGFDYSIPLLCAQKALHIVHDTSVQGRAATVRLHCSPGMQPYSIFSPVRDERLSLVW